MVNLQSKADGTDTNVQFRGVGPDINGFKVGGDFMFLNSIEYQVPVRANVTSGARHTIWLASKSGRARR